MTSHPDTASQTPEPLRPNAQLIRDLYDALEAHDAARIQTVLDPEIVTRQSTELPWGGTFIGHAGFQQFFAGVLHYLDSRVTIERLLDAGEHVVVLGRTAGTVRATGKAFDVPLMHLYELREGKIIRGQICLHDPAMLQALTP